MKRPYLAPKDDGASEHVVNVDLGSRSRAAAPWEKPAPAGRRAPVRPAGTSQRTGGRPQRPAPQAPPPQDAASALSMDPHASASEYTAEDSASFWSMPSIAAVKAPAPAATNAPALSGPAEEFDVATGWNFPALDFDDELEPNLRLSAEERAAPILPTEDEIFSTTGSTPAWTAPAPAPAPPSRPAASTQRAPQAQARPPEPPADVEALLTRGRELLSAGELMEATRLLRRARRAAPDHNAVTTWLDFAERRLMREYVPSAKPDSVPTPTQNRRHLATQASPVERQMLSAIDGVRTLGAIVQAGNDEAFVPMLKMLAAFESRGWITWQ